MLNYRTVKVCMVDDLFLGCCKKFTWDRKIYQKLTKGSLFLIYFKPYIKKNQVVTKKIYNKCFLVTEALVLLTMNYY